MKHNKGFSLVELLVSIAILSIIMVMVVQFMGTASVSLRRTRKQMDLQTGAMEFREQLSDIMMQATYVRIQTKDGKGYKLDTELEDANVNKKRKRVDSASTTPSNITSTDLISGAANMTFVSDNYPSYCKAGSKDLNIYIDKNNYTLFGKDASGNQYPSSVDNSIRSFRFLSESAVSGDSYYVKPEYIYVRYQPTYDIDAYGNTNNIITKEYYAIYHFTDDNRIYMYKGEVLTPNIATDDGFSFAVAKLASDTGENTSNDKYAGLMIDLVREVYVSVDTEANTVMLSAQLYDSEQPKSRRGSEDDSAYAKYIYDYEDSIVFRNSHALTVAPNKLYKREVVTSTPEPSPEEP